MAEAAARVYELGRQLDLRFARAPDGSTYLARQHVAYPFHITRPFAGPHGLATLTLQSVGGGLVQGDRLELAIAVGAGARAHVTSQAATVAHGMPAGPATVHQRLAVEGDGWLAALPDPVILFPAADVTVATSASVADDATLIVADSWLAHDPGGFGRAFARFAGTIEITRPNGTMLAADRSVVDGAAFASRCAGVTEGFGGVAVLLVVTRRVDAARLAERLATVLDDAARVIAGASVLPGDCGVIARVLAADGAALRGALSAALIAVLGALTEARGSA